ncbi:hypothetical protein NLG97_g659 [Lecanicillium saksenae]|uniref:Uncharacterized protein n=1 Tax=Lecanicillium saksenae TaxID=468837 RepID=A0ACC1R6K8_9HYPO|nr:hypothetical protein NLG97_g659 [Lecanicillium saksenae]
MLHLTGHLVDLIPRLHLYVILADQRCHGGDRPALRSRTAPPAAHLVVASCVQDVLVDLQEMEYHAVCQAWEEEEEEAAAEGGVDAADPETHSW